VDILVFNGNKMNSHRWICLCALSLYFSRMFSWALISYLRKAWAMLYDWQRKFDVYRMNMNQKFKYWRWEEGKVTF